MNSLNVLLEDLAEDAPPAAGLLAKAHCRARRLRRQRRVAYGVVATAVVGGVVGSTTLVTRDVRPTAPATYVALGTEGPVVGTGRRHCDGGFARRVPAASVVSQVGLLSSHSHFVLQGKAFARQQRNYCATGAAPLVLVDVDSRQGLVRRGLSLWGPLPVRPDVQGYAGVRSVMVRGQQGDRVRFGDGSLVLSWPEPDGRWWTVRSSGVPEGHLSRIVAGLALDAGPVAVSPVSLIGGFVRSAPSPAGDTREHPVLYARYRTPSGLRIELMVRPAPPYSVASIAGVGPPNAVRFVQVRRHQAVFRNGPAPEALAVLEWEERPGVIAQVSGDGAALEELRGFAESLDRVRAGDPRLGDG